MSIYERIKERRKALGLTADDVAEKLGVSRATIYRYESADIEKLPTSSLEPLAKALQTTPAYLMGWTDDPYEAPEDDTQYKFIPPLTVHEITVMLQYRAKPEMQAAVDTLLGVQHTDQANNVVQIPERQPVKVTRGYAAFGGDGWQSYEVETTPEKEERIEKMMQELDAAQERQKAEDEERRKANFAKLKADKKANRWKKK